MGRRMGPGLLGTSAVSPAVLWAGEFRTGCHQRLSPVLTLGASAGGEQVRTEALLLSSLPVLISLTNCPGKISERCHTGESAG